MGGLFLGVLAMLILITVQRDAHLSQTLDMPVLGYASKASEGLGVMYTLVLFLRHLFYCNQQFLRIYH